MANTCYSCLLRLLSGVEVHLEKSFIPVDEVLSFNSGKVFFFSTSKNITSVFFAQNYEYNENGSCACDGSATFAVVIRTWRNSQPLPQQSPIPLPPVGLHFTDNQNIFKTKYTGTHARKQKTGFVTCTHSSMCC